LRAGLDVLVDVLFLLFLVDLLELFAGKLPVKREKVDKAVRACSATTIQQ
jgi:hypothetical protein